MLTPMEIQNKKFEKAVMGYDREDVNDFMMFLSEDYEALYKQSIESEEKIRSLTQQLETYKNMDETMKNTLLVAQSTAETVQKNASEKAERKTLENINLEIKSGETVGIIGATGSSKTSLIQLISRLYDVSDGSVKVGGIDVRDYDVKTLRDAVSVVLQKNVLFSGT